MKTVEFIRAALGFSAESTLALLDDMRDAPLTFPTPRGGNHPLWILGHLVWSEGDIIQCQMLARPHPAPMLAPLFANNTEPSADASRYPPYDELRRGFDAARSATLRELDALRDEDLDRRSLGVRPGLDPVLGTFARCFLVVVLNTMTHRGQAADARRALGRSKLIV